jgi:hypothetical protein
MNESYNNDKIDPCDEEDYRALRIIFINYAIFVIIIDNQEY